MDDRLQINVRLSPEQVEAIDRKRIELQPAMGKILTRSDVVRYALDAYLPGQANKTRKKQKKGPVGRRITGKGSSKD